MTIGERVRERRIELGLSVDDLARRLGKNRATVYRYENSYIENMPVGIIEPLGIRNGSKRKERRIKMKKITGKKPAVYSSHLGRSVEA